jgi:type II secretory pathway pseudopilin PulG
MFKKGAMFGLDARIALAIFGALSVISGAALYSAIQQSKVIATITQAEELAKATEQYLLDTGVNIRRLEQINASHSNKDFELYAKDLTSDSSVVGWNGPYISLQENPTEESRFIYNGMDFIIIRANISQSWGQGSASSIKCTVATDCNIWIEVNTGSGSIASSIDEYIDGTTGKDTGKVRILSDNSVYINTGLNYSNI